MTPSPWQASQRPPLTLKEKRPGHVAARLRLRQAGEPLADRREGAGIGRRVGARRAADRRLVDVDDLVEMLEALDRVERGRVLQRPVQPARHGLVERVDDQRRLAAARHAGDAGEGAERDLGRHVLEVVAARADDLQRCAPSAACAASAGTGTDMSPVRYLPVSEFGSAMISAGVPCDDDLAAMDAGAGADIDHIVGLQDRVLVVLDHDHGVAEVAQAPQRLQQALVVALVQADRRLVEHVEHAGQAGADLRGEADALALAARQRAGGARQGQVVEPDIEQEGQPVADLLQDAAGDLVLLGVELGRQVRRTSSCASRTESCETSPMCWPAIFTASASGFRRMPVAGRAGRLRHEARRFPRAPSRCPSPSSGAPDWG